MGSWTAQHANARPADVDLTGDDQDPRAAGSMQTPAQRMPPPKKFHLLSVDGAIRL